MAKGNIVKLREQPEAFATNLGMKIVRGWSNQPDGKNAKDWSIRSQILQGCSSTTKRQWIC
jgi:hypothetical protein